MSTTAPFALARPVNVDPIAKAQEFASLRALALQSQQGQMQLQQQRQAMADDQNARQLFKNNPNPSTQDILGAIGPKAGIPIDKDLRDAQKAGLDMQKSRLEHDMKATEFASQILGTVTDEPTYQRGLAQMKAAGLPTDQMPPQYNPEVVKQYVQKGLGIQQQLEQKHKDIELQMKQELQGPTVDKTKAEAAHANAQAEVENLQKQLTQHKLDLYNTLKSAPGTLEARVAKAVDPKKYPDEYTRTLTAAQNAPDLEGIEKAVKDGGDRIGHLESTIAGAKATAPIKINIAAATQAAKNAQNTPGQDALDLMAEDALNGKYPPGRNQILYSKVMDRAAALAKERGMTAQQTILERNAAQANNAAFKTVTKQYETLKPFADMADKNATILEQKMKDVSDLGTSLLNTPLRSLENKFGSTKVTALKAAMQPVQADFARILNSPTGGGVLSDHARQEMQGAIQEGATVGQIKSALDVFRTDAKNRRESYEANLQDLKARSVSGGKSEAPKATHRFNPATGKIEAAQ